MSKDANEDREESLFDAALPLPTTDREALLDEACSDDPRLRASVDELLRLADGADDEEPTGRLSARIREVRFSSQFLGLARRLAAGGAPVEDERWTAFLDQLRTRADGQGRYVIEDVLASGGMGVVHKVEDRNILRPLAMKVARGTGPDVDGAAPADPRTVARFLEEAQVTGQLDHPGIVPVHEIGMDAEGRLFFTMKLVRGDDLRRVFERVTDSKDEDWTLPRALHVVQRVCEAMAFAHAKGVIHRDLKPANVMVGDYGEVYVMDWGLARVLTRDDAHDLRIRPSATTDDPARSGASTHANAESDELVTMDGDVLGTPAYMPPEQAHGLQDAVGPGVDVYAVGAMLYHLLAGHAPYTPPGESRPNRAVLAAVREGPPTPLGRVATDAAPELVAIVEKAMARRREERYPSMTALGRDLRAFLERRVVAAYETGFWAVARKWMMRNKALSIAGMLLLVLLPVTIVSLFAAREIGAKADEIARERDLATSAQQRAEQLAEPFVEVTRLQELRERIRGFWPPDPSPEQARARADWIHDAEDHRADLPMHRRRLDELRGLADLQSRGGPSSTDAALYDLATAEMALLALVQGIEDMCRPDRYEPTIESVEFLQREVDRSIALTIESDEARAAWDAARAAIRAHADYGFDLPPQFGLLPLGPDPESGLWEFWHALSGARPERVEGRWKITEGTAVVLVLIPGGTFRMGAQKTDPAAPNYDPLAETDECDESGAAVEVELSPYFLSKYELTLAQWHRLRGQVPEPLRNGTSLSRTMPVCRVDWPSAHHWLPRFGLMLPTEAQWERAARGGTATPWWTGDDPWKPLDVGSLPVRTWLRRGEQLRWPNKPSHLVQADSVPRAVGELAANPYGLHDIIGNVWEWCRDPYDSGAYHRPARPGDGARALAQDEKLARVVRGGGWGAMRELDVIRGSRAAGRSWLASSAAYHDRYTGIRPARPCFLDR